MHVCFHWTKNINTVPTWRHIYLLNDCLFHNAIPDDFSFFIGKSLWGADLSPAFVTFLLLILILMFSVLKHKGPEMWRSDTQIELAGCKWICWLNHRTLKNKSPVLMICTVSLSPWPSSPKHFSFTMITSTGLWVRIHSKFFLWHSKSLIFRRHLPCSAVPKGRTCSSILSFILGV